MDPNQDNKAGQPVDDKANQPIVPEVKQEETNSNTLAANQVKQPGLQEKKVQPVEPTATDHKKISDTPDTKEPKEDEVKGETTRNSAHEKTA